MLKGWKVPSKLGAAKYILSNISEYIFQNIYLGNIFSQISFIEDTVSVYIDEISTF